MLVLLLLSGLWFFGYILGITFVYKKVLPSISESWYVLGKKGYLFTIWCFLIAFLQAPLLLELANDTWYQFTGFFTAAGLAFVGAAPAFKGYERRIHRTGTGIAAVFSILYTIFSGWGVIIGSLALIYIVSSLLEYWSTKKIVNYLFWAEFYCFVSLFTVELILLTHGN